MNLARATGPADGQVEAGITPPDSPATLPDLPPVPGSSDTARAWRIICTVMSVDAVMLLVYNGARGWMSWLSLVALGLAPWLIYGKWGRE